MSIEQGPKPLAEKKVAQGRVYLSNAQDFTQNQDFFKALMGFQYGEGEEYEEACKTLFGSPDKPSEDHGEDPK